VDEGNKFKMQICTGDVMASIIWDSEGLLLMEFLKRGATVNSERHVRTLKKLKQRIRRVWPNRKVNRVLIIPTVPISAPAEFQLFGLLKDALRGRRFADDDKLKHSLREEHRSFSTEVYATGIQLLMQGWKKCVDNEERFFWKK
jgi:hypothetical protein